MGFGQIIMGGYAVLIFIGGLIGLIHKHSVISLIASSLLAGLLFVAVNMAYAKPKRGLGLGAILILVSLGQFVPSFIKKHTFFPGGLYSILGILAFLLIGLAWLQATASGPTRQGKGEYPL